MKNSRIKKNNSGLTLIELLVGLAISMIIIVAAFSLILVGSDSYNRTNKTTTLQQEVSFINNLLSSNIREGKQQDTSIIKYSKGDVALATGNVVFYYSKSKQSLFVYKGASIDDETTYNGDKDTNLISKYVTEFDMSFEQTDDGMGTLPSYSSGSKVTGYSNLIKVTMTVKVKDKSDTSQILYNIRNYS